MTFRSRPKPSSATHLVRNILIRHGGYDRHRVWLEYPVGSYWLDIFLPDYGVGIEVDGPAHKKYRAKRDADNRKSAAIDMAGIRLLRIPVSELSIYKTEPQLLIEHISAFIRYRPPGKEQDNGRAT